MRIVQSEFVEFRDDYVGFCPSCDAFTSEGVDPEADDPCKCEECESESVVGIETAMMFGYVVVTRKSPEIVR